MNFIAKFAAVSSALLVSACDVTPDATHSGFVTPTASGAISTDINNAQTRVTNDGSGNGYSLQIGGHSDGDGGLKGVAGILPTTAVGATVTGGNVEYVGRYNALTIRNITVSDNFATGTAAEETGAITLNANFGTGKLTGGGGRLTVNGSISGKKIGGGANYDGVKTKLAGQIGADRAVGVFHGNTDSTIVVGGFIVNP